MGARAQIGRPNYPWSEFAAGAENNPMHLPGDPREREALGTPQDRWKFYFEMLDFGYETAIAGLMKSHHCERPEAVRLLAQSYQRLDEEKLESLRRAATLMSRAR